MSQPTVEGRVVGERPQGSIRIAYGKRWVIGGDVAATSFGAFSVPDTAKAVVAYVDTNHNGKLDRFAEPSGDCLLLTGSWWCSIVSQRTTLHRSIAVRGHDHNDKTYVFWENFSSDGIRVDDSRLCVDRRCTHREPSPFLSRASRDVDVFSICGEEGFAPQQAKLQGQGRELVVPIEQPARFEPAVRAERSGYDLTLHIAEPSRDRAIIWAGTVDANTGEISQVYWSSEDPDIDMIATPTGLDVRIPAANVKACQQVHDCEIGAQLLTYWSGFGSSLVSATEYRTSVDFRGLL